MKKRKKIAEVLISLDELFRKNNKKVKISSAAFQLGYTYFYFKYFVLKQLIEITECIKYDPKEDTIEYICEQEH